YSYYTLLSFFYSCCDLYTYLLLIFFFNDPPTTEIYTLSLHDALPIYEERPARLLQDRRLAARRQSPLRLCLSPTDARHPRPAAPDRKSTRLNSSHDQISYAVFCLKKKKKKQQKKHI